MVHISNSTKKPYHDPFPTAICPVCGKEFVYTTQWAYKLRVKKNILKYCSYSCYRHAEKYDDGQVVKRPPVITDSYSREYILNKQKHLIERTISDETNN